MGENDRCGHEDLRFYVSGCQNNTFDPRCVDNTYGSNAVINAGHLVPVSNEQECPEIRISPVMLLT